MKKKKWIHVFELQCLRLKKKKIKNVYLKFKIQDVPGKLLHMFFSYVNRTRKTASSQFIYELMIYINVDTNTSLYYKISQTR